MRTDEGFLLVATKLLFLSIINSIFEIKFFFTLIFFKDFKTEFIIFFECNIPIFIESGFISFEVNSICFDISLEDIGKIENTPVVFCEVIAVIAVIA